VTVLGDGDVRVKNRSDALIFAKSRSCMSNFKRPELGEVSGSEAQHWTEDIYSARSLENASIFPPIPLARYRCAKLGSGTGRALRALPRGSPLSRIQYKPFFPLLHNPPTQPTNHTHTPCVMTTIHHHNLNLLNHTSHREIASRDIPTQTK